MAQRDYSESLVEAVRAAADTGSPLRLVGGGSKDFYGRAPAPMPDHDVVDISRHRGIVNHEPTELILTARAGTRLRAIEAALHREGQMMPFEPPHFSGRATLGGAIAAGLSGPRRPWGGSARDFVLGVRLINGRGEHMRFGGEVMKNVAGYDVSRLVTGSLGMLGIITEVSLKVLPAPAAEATRVLDLPAEAGFARVEQAHRDGMPIAAAAHDGHALYVRLAGATRAVDSGIERLGGDALGDGPAFWRALRDHKLPFFQQAGSPTWRISLPPGTRPPRLPGRRLLDWNGQLVWQRTDADPATVFAAAAERGGHATLMQGGDRSGDVFQPLAPAVRRLHERVKAAFDPQGLFNPGRMYEGL